MSSSALIVGCGYIGMEVARRWLATGTTVAALTRRRGDELRASGIEPVLGDVTEPDRLAFPKTDLVLYAVGMDRSAGKSMRDVYVNGLRHVVDRLSPESRFVYISSTSVYGQTDGSWVDESSPTEPIEDSGKICLEAEQALRSIRPDAIILRSAGQYGPGRVLRRAAIERGEPLAADPEGWLNLIHLHDAARAIIVASTVANPGETLILADDRPATRREFYSTMASLLGAPPAAFVPTSPTTLSANRRLRNTRLKQSLGFTLQYPSFEQGLQQAIR